MEKQNAPGRKAEGVVCLHSRADIDAYTASAARCHYLTQRGIPFNWTRLVAGLAFGELRHG